MVAQLIITLLVLLSMCTSGYMIAAAQKEIQESKTTQTEATQPVDPEAEVKGEAPPGESAPAKPVKTEAAQQPKAADPIMIELSSPRSIYHNHEDIMVNAEIWAVQPTTLCVYPNRPEAHFSVDMYRSGHGKVELPPTVVQLKRREMLLMEKVELKPGQMHRMLFNLKKVATMPPNYWKTGEYQIKVKYFLCDPKKEDNEKTISAQTPLQLLVLD